MKKAAVSQTPSCCQRTSVFKIAMVEAATCQARNNLDAADSKKIAHHRISCASFGFLKLRPIELRGFECGLRKSIRHIVTVLIGSLKFATATLPDSLGQFTLEVAEKRER